MKYIKSLLPLIFIILMFACKKNKNPQPTQNVTIDTLYYGWQKIQTNLQVNFYDIWFINAATGFACANEGLYSSVDSGKTWTIKTSQVKRYSNLFFVSNTVGYAQRNDSIAVTIDGGNNWVIKKGPPMNVSDIYFISTSTGFAFANGKQLYKTNDGATTWSPVSNYSASAMFFLNSLTGFMKHSDGFIYNSTDGGNTWQINSTTNISIANWEYLVFNDINNGWLINSMLGVYKTSDAGVTWNNKLSLNNAIDCNFFNNQEGYVSTLSNIYFTSDGGNTWRTDVIAHTGQIIEMHFIDRNTGWACGSNGLILRYKK
jgi:photosystem II stability/assembly factor-like uncharacterized protein